jgi:hypothetical protein
MTPPLVSLAAHASSHLTNGEAALLLRLHNPQVSVDDISLMTAMSGHAEFTTDEVQVLWRPQNLNLPMEDINLIVDTVRRRRSHNTAVALAHNNTDQHYTYHWAKGSLMPCIASVLEHPDGHLKHHHHGIHLTRTGSRNMSTCMENIPFPPESCMVSITGMEYWQRKYPRTFALPPLLMDSLPPHTLNDPSKVPRLPRARQRSSLCPPSELRVHHTSHLLWDGHCLSRPELPPLISSPLHNHKWPANPWMSRRMTELLQSLGFNELQVLLHNAALLEKKLEEEDDCSSDPVATAPPSLETNAKANRTPDSDQSRSHSKHSDQRHQSVYHQATLTPSTTKTMQSRSTDAILELQFSEIGSLSESITEVAEF